MKSLLLDCHYFSESLMKKYNSISFVRVQLEDLIERPRQYAKIMCGKLGLYCDEKYIKGVVSGILESPNPSRNGVDWTDKQIETIDKIVADYPNIFAVPRHNKLR